MDTAVLAAVTAKPRTEYGAPIRPPLTSAARDGFAVRSDGGTAVSDRTEEQHRGVADRTHTQRSFTVQTGVARPITDESSDGPK
jgi:hypothetical protein